MKSANQTDRQKTYPSAQLLLNWYDHHARKLPWRSPPNDGLKQRRPDAYRVWLSEIMLQQTTVTTVIPYYVKFLENWPSLRDMAQASLQDILATWAGLGYYSRARNLKACVDIIMLDHGGAFPKTAEALKKLPGIGDYTSAAIAAIAFNEPVAVIDGNVERVITRLQSIEDPLPAAKKHIKQICGEIVPTKRPGDFAQAMMDLGATICTPKKPACALCPWNNKCSARLSGEPEKYPIKAPKKIRPTRYGNSYVLINRRSQIYLNTRADKGLLAQMTEIPGTDWHCDPAKSSSHPAFLQAFEWNGAGQIEHIFTHFHLVLKVFTAETDSNPSLLANGRWAAISNLHQEALPTVMKKAVICGLAVHKRTHPL